jgi:WD40 repeat protein/tetratricopeptide (TPR) repeat protein
VLAAFLDGTAQVWDAETGAARFADPPRHARAVNRAAFSPDGRWLVTGSDDHTARVWDAATGRPRGKPLEFDSPVAHVAFHPHDGDKVLAVAGLRFDRTRQVTDPGPPRTQMIPAGIGPGGVPRWIPQIVPGPGIPRQERPEGEAQVWDAATGQRTGQPVSLDGWMEHAAFSPDGRLVAVAGGSEEGDNEVEVWDWAAGKPLGEPLGHDAHVHHVAFSPDGRRLVTAAGQPGGAQGEARVWEVAGGKSVGRPMKHSGPVTVAAFSPDGGRVLTASHDQTARVWDAATGDPLTPPLRHRDALAGAWFSPDGRRVLTAGRDGAARVWDGHTGEPLTPLLRHAGPLTWAAFAPDGRRLLTAGQDGTVRLWDLAGGGPARPALYHHEVIQPPPGNVTYIERRGDADEPRQRSRSNLGDLVVSAAVVAPDGRHVLTGAGTHVRETITGAGRPYVGVAVKTFALCWWDAATGKLEARLPHDLPVTAAALSPDGTRLAAVAVGGTKDVAGVRLWDLKANRVVAHRPPVQGRAVKAVAFAPTGACYLAAVSAAAPPAGVGEVVVREVESDAVVATLPLDGVLELAAFGPAARRLVTVTLTKGPDRKAPRLTWSAQVWDLAGGGRRLGSALPHDRPVTRVALSPDGGRLLAYGAGPSEATLQEDMIQDAEPDEAVSLWEVVPDGEVKRHRLEHAGAVTFAGFSPDGAAVVTTSADRTARVWSAADGRPLTPPLEHRGRVNHAAFGPGGLLATAGGDRTACLWQVPTGERVAPPLPHREEVLHVAFGPGGLLVTSGADGVARLWDLAPDARPPDDLTKLARLLSGARLDDTRGVTPLDPAAVADLWRELRQASPEEFTAAGAAMLAWHRDEAADAERTGDWPAIVPHLERLLAADPGQAGLRVRLARADARLGRWDEAEANYARAIELGVDNPVVWHALAVLQVHGGRLDDYRRTCASVVRRFGATDDAGVARLVARTCVLAPDAVADFAPVLHLAEKAAAGGQPDERSPGGTLGAAFYRAGRFEEAVQKLSAAGKTPGGSGPWDGFFLALACQRLGRAGEAKQHLEAAARRLTEGSGDAAPWTERLPLQSLQAEAESLVKESGP